MAIKIEVYVELTPEGYVFLQNVGRKYKRRE